MGIVTQKKRLEKGLAIALIRAHGGDEEYASFLVDNLEIDEEAPEYAPRPYQGWQDAKRIINQLEALERSEGIEHVRVSSPSYLDKLYSMLSDELTRLFRKALDQGDQYTADLARDVLHTR